MPNGRGGYFGGGILVRPSQGMRENAQLYEVADPFCWIARAEVDAYCLGQGNYFIGWEEGVRVGLRF